MNFSKGPQTPEARARQAQTKFMEEAVQKVEKYFGALCQEMGGVTRKSARLRDKYDAMAKTCLDYANVEPGPLNRSLTRFAEHLSAVQDYRQAEIERLQAKVVDPLSTYGSECKHTQNDLNKSFKARKQEIKQQQKVETMHHRSPSDRHAISQAEAELQKRTLDVARSTRSLEETIDKFEVKKVQDLKQILTDFVKVEMLFHAKALEVYTLAYNDLTAIDEEEHIEMFRNSLRPETNMQERMDLAKNVANVSLNEPSPSHEGRQSRHPTPKPRDRANTRTSRQESEEDYEEEEEEDADWGSEEETEDDDYDDDEDAVEEMQPRHARTKPW